MLERGAGRLLIGDAGLSKYLLVFIIVSSKLGYTLAVP